MIYFPSLSCPWPFEKASSSPRKILELASEQGLFSSWNYFKFMNLQLSTLLPRELTPPVIQHPWSWQSTNITIFSPSLTLLISLFPSISSQNSNGLSLALPCLTILTRQTFTYDWTQFSAPELELCIWWQFRWQGKHFKHRVQIAKFWQVPMIMGLATITVAIIIASPSSVTS